MTTALDNGVGETMSYSLMYEGKQRTVIGRFHMRPTEKVKTTEAPLPITAMRSLLDLLSEERWNAYEWMQLKFALKTSGGETYRDLFIEQSRNSLKFEQWELVRMWDEVDDTSSSDYRNSHPLRKTG